MLVDLFDRRAVSDLEDLEDFVAVEDLMTGVFVLVTTFVGFEEGRAGFAAVASKLLADSGDFAAAFSDLGAAPAVGDSFVMSVAIDVLQSSAAASKLLASVDLGCSACACRFAQTLVMLRVCRCLNSDFTGACWFSLDMYMYLYTSCLDLISFL
jgi:hypothetical protein